MSVVTLIDDDRVRLFDGRLRAWPPGSATAHVDCPGYLDHPRALEPPARARRNGRISGLGRLTQALRWLLRPARARDRDTTTGSLVTGSVCDAFRSPSQLVLENALLRKQLQVLSRSVTRPTIQATGRLGLLLLPRLTSRWRSVLVMIQPEALLCWHRDAFRAFLRRRSRRGPRRSELASEPVALIRQMASENRLWGAERVR